MAELDINKTSRTDLTNSYDDYSVNAQVIDEAGEQNETEWNFPDANTHLGYYKSIPELKKAIDSLSIWTVGKGVQANDFDSVIIENWKGWGEDTFQSIMENLIVQKKVFGDAFAEIIRNDNGTIINLKPLNPSSMSIIVNDKGMIIRYEQRIGKKQNKPIKFKPSDILHLCNDRIANEIHGTSVIEACKWIIDARNEALTDHRKVLHRNVVPVRIIEVDTDDTTARDKLITEYEEAIAKGEVLVIPKGTVEIKDTSITIQDPITWIQYLEGFFYQAVGIPRVIATSENFTEAASKVGYLTFEPIYTREQTLLEQDLFNQLAIKVKFNRPPSLSGLLQQSEEKNTGQTGFQQNEVQASATRNE